LSIQKIYPKSSTPAEQYKSYFNYRKTTDYYEKDSGLSGLGEADFVDENGVVTVDVPIQCYDKTYTQNQVDHMVTFSNVCGVSEFKREPWIILPRNSKMPFGAKRKDSARNGWTTVSSLSPIPTLPVARSLAPLALRW